MFQDQQNVFFPLSTTWKLYNKDDRQLDKILNMLINELFLYFALKVLCEVFSCLTNFI